MKMCRYLIECFFPAAVPAVLWPFAPVVSSTWTWIPIFWSTGTASDHVLKSLCQCQGIVLVTTIWSLRLTVLFLNFFNDVSHLPPFHLCFISVILVEIYVVVFHIIIQKEKEKCHPSLWQWTSSVFSQCAHSNILLFIVRARWVQDNHLLPISTNVGICRPTWASLNK